MKTSESLKKKKIFFAGRGVRIPYKNQYPFTDMSGVFPVLVHFDLSMFLKDFIGRETEGVSIFCNPRSTKVFPLSQGPSSTLKLVVLKRRHRTNINGTRGPLCVDLPRRPSEVRNHTCQFLNLRSVRRRPGVS